MKKFIFCCLVVLIASCKDKNEVKPDVDFTSQFVGDYFTQTADGASGAEHTWTVTAIGKNLLGIVYTKKITGTISGAQVSITQNYAMANVVATADDAFEINEEVDVEQTPGSTFKQKVQGVATKVLNGSGVQQINITLKITNSSSLATSEEYLEFKKK